MEGEDKIEDVKEYHIVMEYIQMMREYFKRAVSDIQLLEDAQHCHLNNPLGFVRGMQAGKLDFPVAQTIPSPPSIDFGQFRAIRKRKILEKRGGKSGIKRSKSISDLREYTPEKKADIRGKRPPCLSNVQLFDFQPVHLATKIDQVMKSAKKQTAKKVATPGAKGVKSMRTKLWSERQQARLLALLEEYPEEEIAVRRWTKISDAFDHEFSPKQIAGRVRRLKEQHYI